MTMTITTITLPRHTSAAWWTPEREKAIRRYARSRGISAYHLRSELEPGRYLVTLRWSSLTLVQVYTRIDAIAGEGA